MNKDQNDCEREGESCEEVDQELENQELDRLALKKLSNNKVDKHIKKSFDKE